MPDHPTYRGQVLDAAKDPLDLRDIYYEGNLEELPPWVNNRGKVPFVLDQQKEGACTGFALAAVVNYLLHNKAGAPMLKRAEGGSARMLYEMAKRYDEWEGQRYQGSSVRGAMKGWHKHGVCREASWPYRTNDRNPRLTRNRPGGCAEQSARLLFPRAAPAPQPAAQRHCRGRHRVRQRIGAQRLVRGRLRDRGDSPA